MNYKKHYSVLIDRSPKIKLKGQYLESHHIIPRCVGGTNDPDNLVFLTPEEHYVAHQLLVKIYPQNSKLMYAANMMSKNSNQQQRNNNKSFGWIRRKLSKQVSLDKVGNKNMLGKKHSPATINKISKAKSGKQSWTKLTADDVKQIRVYFNDMIAVDNLDKLGEIQKNGRRMSYKRLFSFYMAKVYPQVTLACIMRIIENKSWV